MDRGHWRCGFLCVGASLKDKAHANAKDCSHTCVLVRPSTHAAPGVAVSGE